jgi:hypothetical protein
MFNTCSRGPTHQFLTNTCEGYNIRGAGLPYHTPRSSQSTVLRFSPKGPTWSQVNLSNKFQLNQEVINPNLTSGIHHSTSTISYHLSIALLTVSHQDDMDIRINQKDDLITTMVSYNAYQPNAQPYIT